MVVDLSFIYISMILLQFESEAAPLEEKMVELGVRALSLPIKKDVFLTLNSFYQYMLLPVILLLLQAKLCLN